MNQPLMKGIIGYLVTPFDDSGIDVPVLHQMIDRLLQSGVHAIAPLGSTGEAAYLKDQEWNTVATETCRRVAGRVPTIIGIAEVSTAAAMDKALGQLYYSKPEELCARAFEAFVQDAAITNHFLVKGTKTSPEAERGLYPQGEQRAQINGAFSDYFSALGAALGYGR